MSSPKHHTLSPITTLVPLVEPRVHRERDAITPAVRSALSDLVLGHCPWPLFLTGQTGSGKTCAALCMIDAYGGLYRTCLAWCEEMALAKRGEFFKRYANCEVKIYPGTLRRDWTHQPLVVLDDLGVRDKPTDHERETVKECLDGREGLPAVFVSNLSLSALARVYDDRIASRLGSGTVVEMQGDRRVATCEPAPTS